MVTKKNFIIILVTIFLCFLIFCSFILFERMRGNAEDIRLQQIIASYIVFYVYVKDNSRDYYTEAAIKYDDDGHWKLLNSDGHFVAKWESWYMDIADKILLLHPFVGKEVRAINSGETFEVISSDEVRSYIYEYDNRGGLTIFDFHIRAW